jgi:polynucleotide 5'-hydroxyl-kinase GRC3/NOL9
METPIDIPTAWRQLDAHLFFGVVLIIGGSDAGKSTFVRYLAERLAPSRRVALVDGDIGQTTMGPPTTQTLRMLHADASPAQGAGWFVGATSPAGHMLQTLIGLQRLVQRAWELGAETVLVDTTGLIDSRAGGEALKWSKFDLLRPHTVVALQRADELEPILSPWRQSGRFLLVEPPLSERVEKTSPAQRNARRRENFRRHFRDVRLLQLSLETIGVTGRWPLQKGQLVGLCGKEGFLEAVGVVEALEAKEVWLRTPLPDPRVVDMLRTGSLLLDEAMNETPIR